MKCLQCGTEIDRLAKWRAAVEYCSEDCKKKSKIEFDRLAMSRLMQLRPVRAAVDAAGKDGQKERGGPVAVAEAPAPRTAPSALSAPPEAGFIMEAPVTLAELQLRHQPAVVPAALLPFIPVSDLAVAGALHALEQMIADLRPERRSARTLNHFRASEWALPAGELTELQLPECEPDWAAALGVEFLVSGFESGSMPATAPAPANRCATIGEIIAERPLPGPPAVRVSIPQRRAARTLKPSCPFAVGSERHLAPPVVSAPRLRIHLPKPALNPFRPRYAFGMPPVGKAAEELGGETRPAPDTLEEEGLAEAPVEATVSRRDERKKRRGGRHNRPTAIEKPIASEKPTASEKPVAIEKAIVSEKPVASEAKNESAAPGAVAPLKVVEPKTGEPKKTAPVSTLEIAPAAVMPTHGVLKAPSFGGKSEARPDGLWDRTQGWKKAAVILVAAGIAVGAWGLPAWNRHAALPAMRPPSAAPAAVSMGPESWETNPATDESGNAVHRRISLYRPGRGKRDYSMEFTGQIEQRALGWVFRMKDAKNYYCLKVELSGDGPGATAQLVKFAVVNGVEQPHRLIPLRQPLPRGGPLKVRLDVRGQNFSTQLNGNPVDVWMDNQIADGTVGFSNENGERAVIRTVRVTY